MLPQKAATVDLGDDKVVEVDVQTGCRQCMAYPPEVPVVIEVIKACDFKAVVKDESIQQDESQQMQAGTDSEALH